MLRNENAQLKAQGVIQTIVDLPTLLDIPPVPDLVSADLPSPPSSSEEMLMTPFTRSKGPRDLNDKALWREMIDFQTDATVIDISRIRPGTAWLPQKTLPEIQLYEREKRGKALRRRAERRTRQLSHGL